VNAIQIGDDLIPNPGLAWTISETIDAPASTVYSWLIQMGDTRAAFYSYMFIEKMITSQDLYNNADRIHPEWQTPERGKQGIIANVLVIKDYQPGSGCWPRIPQPWAGWAEAGCGGSFPSTRPTPAGQPDAHPDTGKFWQQPIVLFILDTGGFVMEQNMMQGIAERAEGRGEAAITEPIEIILWLVALATGLAAAWFFLNQLAWQKPLALGLLAVAALFVLTFVQPPLILRALIDLALVAARSGPLAGPLLMHPHNRQPQRIKLSI